MPQKGGGWHLRDSERRHLRPSTVNRLEDPFSHFDFDGVLGLGLQTLALSRPGKVIDV